jgi:hypothetical protein|tara:strand:+ start:1326 stop:1640 length:315 start_codon:yes stop_codon:yes gene_type:complete
MTDLLIFLLLGVGFLYFVSAIRCKDVAIWAARRECRLNGVQLLDHTVYQVWISLKRDSNDDWRIWRRYKFDYSDDGENRHSGDLVLLGRQVVRIRMESFMPPVH